MTKQERQQLSVTASASDIEPVGQCPTRLGQCPTRQEREQAACGVRDMAGWV